MVFEPRFRMGPPPGASPPMRMLHHGRIIGIHRIQVCRATSAPAHGELASESINGSRRKAPPRG